jgi:geranylgeranyl diphosphate synthase type II
MEKIECWKEKIEERIRELFNPDGPDILKEAMGYYLFQGGKRIRPLILVATCDALGGPLEDALSCGAVIEMIHNYSLIHDDLPAMDNDDFRRGLPSCHKKYGEAVAILAGDALLTYAFEILTKEENFPNLSCQQILKLIQIIANLSGSVGMVGGQVLDILKRGSPTTVNEMKTASLFRAVFTCAGVIAARDDRLKELDLLGLKVGLIFQLTDDILDQDGLASELGKDAIIGEIKRLRNSIDQLVNRIFSSRKEELIKVLDPIWKRINLEP